ncbi:MAG: P1 family peptidase [Deltaproteobacteria bacterium]|jgi:L-aminopeptidase/D-esterase-like protein|nr:P1 family peptidase [Deltaproteobacteria bacterium]
MREITISEVAGILAGHAEEASAGTGCTVVISPKGAVGACWTPGFAPGSRETEALKPEGLTGQVHGVCLAGGSALGLAAASGVARYLAEEGIGFDIGSLRVPIVSAAVIFDYPGNLSGGSLPDEGTGYRAAAGASKAPLPGGPHGAGVSACSGRIAGPELYSPSGIGLFGVELPSGLQLAALAVANPLGSVTDRHTGRILSGARLPGGGLADRDQIMGMLERMVPLVGDGAADGKAGGVTEATTLAVVATNAPLGRLGSLRLARMASAGMARTIYPAHLLFDGDTVFALATGGGPSCGESWLGALAADVLAEAIMRSVPQGGL